jgi:MFS family permease
VIWVAMMLTAATELGPGQWYANVFNEVMVSATQAGILVLVWVNGIMYLMRQFAGGISHRVSPIALVAVTSVLAAAGLYFFSVAQTPVAAFAAAALLAVGTAFWWPTMLGITSERFPKSGALGLAIIGGTGSFATAIAGPVMGYLNDIYGPREMLAIWALLPVALVAIFGAIYLRDKAAGGYRVEHIGA